jgi:hypothetical protein
MTTDAIQSGSTDPEEVRFNGAGSISELGPATKSTGKVNTTRSNPLAQQQARRDHRSPALPLNFLNRDIDVGQSLRCKPY